MDLFSACPPRSCNPKKMTHKKVVDFMLTFILNFNNIDKKAVL